MLHRSITASLFLMLLLGLTLFTSGIAEAQNPPQNNAPTPVGAIPNQTVTLGGTAATVEVTPYFNDADADPLTYTATSSDTAIATVSVSDSTVTDHTCSSRHRNYNRYSNRLQQCNRYTGHLRNRDSEQRTHHRRNNCWRKH